MRVVTAFLTTSQNDFNNMTVRFEHVSNPVLCGTDVRLFSALLVLYFRQTATDKCDVISAGSGVQRPVSGGYLSEVVEIDLYLMASVRF